MNKYEITGRIEKFAPLDTQEKWDCSGWVIDLYGYDEISKVMLCLTVTEDIVNQAKAQNCEMIISHHPLFYVPINWGDINIYCAHTNMDLAYGGTTDTLIKELGFSNTLSEGFVRYVNESVTLKELAEKLSKVSPNFRYVNKENKEKFKKLAFCAGSGSEFINEAYENGADAFITGDLKFHAAIESPIAVFDIGHFESEIFILKVFKELIGNNISIVFAKENSPFIY